MEGAALRADAAPSRAFLAGWMVTSLIAEIAAVLFGILSIAINMAGALEVAAFEGVLLALGQSALLGRWVGNRVATLWALGTVAGAILGRAAEYYVDVKFGPGTGGWNMAAQLGGGVALGFAVGALMGLPQAVTLWRSTSRVWVWPIMRGAAWAFALPLLLLAADATPAATPANAFGGVLFAVVGIPALVVGAIEGLTMMRLLAPPGLHNFSTPNRVG